MRTRNEDSIRNAEPDWIINMGGMQILIEMRVKAVRDHIADRLQMFSNEFGELVQHPPDEQGYRLINGYRVREIFAGEESLTNLLTQYVERTVALHY